MQHARAHRGLPCARPYPRLARVGTAQQIAFHRIGPQPHRQFGQGIERGDIVLAFGGNQQVGQHFAQQQIAVAVFHRPGAGDQIGLMRESGEQPLGESVDRIDPQAAARAIEHFGKQRARPCLAFGADVRADRLQVRRQGLGPGADPAGQHFVDPRGHLGRPGLGEGEAQHLAGADVRLQQQPQHARGKHLGLARARRSREPDHVARFNRRALLIGQREQAFIAHAPSPSVRPRACHSSSRISWS